MNNEIDNTKSVKVMIFEASERNKETEEQMLADGMYFMAKGWKMLLESLSYSPNFRFVLYWPEYKSNDNVQTKEIDYGI